MTNIKSVNNDGNRFCGPAVLSSITGCSTNDAEQVIKDITGQTRSVKGVYDNDLCEAFKRLGWDTSYYTHLDNKGSLFYVLSVLSVGIYVLIVPGHYICIEVGTDGRRYLCDSHTKKPINAGASARLSQRVLRVIRVEKKEVESNG